ncbi:MBL fold metallo-hydrolase [Deferribacter abyssi]|uniref:MBL fold metallo-hydrolase n=1 Tax=Deferribacter abyssi TaxID=213806 RepID=UPI003C202655
MITILGSRGTIPVSGYEYVKYGGCTPSLLARMDDVAIIFDAGTGIYKINTIRSFKKIHIFLSHLHWDHIMGLPIFSYFYRENIDIFIYVDDKNDLDTSNFIRYLFKEPFFPVSHEKLSCNLSIIKIDYDSKYLFGDYEIIPFPGCHPNGASMFLIYNSKIKCLYATDFEHGSDKDDILVEAAKGVDYLIYDTTYTPDDFLGVRDGINKKGWGHSTFEYGVKFAKKSKSKNLILFHHNPDYVDCFIDEIVIMAKKQFSQTIASYDGMVLQ